MNPHYYIMKSKKILRLEADVSFDSLPLNVREKVLEDDDVVVLDQDQANWRVAIFRDEILDYSEYSEWLTTPEALIEEEQEYEIAN